MCVIHLLGVVAPPPDLSRPFIGGFARQSQVPGPALPPGALRFFVGPKR